MSELPPYLECASKAFTKILRYDNHGEWQVLQTVRDAYRGATLSDTEVDTILTCSRRRDGECRFEVKDESEVVFIRVVRSRSSRQERNDRHERASRDWNA